MIYFQVALTLIAVVTFTILGQSIARQENPTWFASIAVASSGVFLVVMVSLITYSS